MGWRVRKSVKIAPGTRLNISKSGVSATTRMGKTGIYHRTQLVGGRRSKSSGKPGCLTVALIVGFLFIVAAFLYAAWQTFVWFPKGVIIAVVAVLAAIVAAFIVVKKRSAVTITPEECGPWTFVLTGNLEPEKQAELKKLKIDTAANGCHSTLALSDEGGRFAVTLGEVFLGDLQSEDAAWASVNFHKIEKLNYFYIHGGDRDKAGNLRPLTVEVRAELIPGTLAPHFSDVELPESEICGFSGKGDAVVYVSSGGIIHTGACSANLQKCTPTLYQDAVDNGFEDCGNCFR